MSAELKKAVPFCVLTICLVASSVDSAAGQVGPAIRFVNQLDESITIWFQPEGSDTYLRPPLLVGPKNGANVALSAQFRGKRWIVIEDESHSYTHVGWVDLPAIARSTKPTLLVEGVFVTEQVPENFTVRIPYSETVIGSDGRSYTVTRYRYETQTRTKSVKVRKIVCRRLTDAD